MEQLTSTYVQNDDPKDDCEIHNIQKEKIKSSPREKDWTGQEHMVQYEGFWYHERILELIMAAQENLEPRSIDDILLASHMKSGKVRLEIGRTSSLLK
ncbi:hypothetical protein M5689_002765 [Euphorbia peplus]|nr:hypothetical protein M5689_002765 [Euphorbia peplus]